MNRDPNGNPDRTGEYPKVLPPPPAPAYPPREGPDVPDKVEERAPIAWREKLVEVGLAIALLAALGLFVWSWFQFTGGGR